MIKGIETNDKTPDKIIKSHCDISVELYLNGMESQVMYKYADMYKLFMDFRKTFD